MHKYTKIGISLFLVAACIHFFARDITWPESASWGTQVEATSFYSKQKAVENISLLLMVAATILFSFGIWETRNIEFEATKKKKVYKHYKAYDHLEDSEHEAFTKWLEKDHANQYLKIDEQIRNFKQSMG